MILKMELEQKFGKTVLYLVECMLKEKKKDMVLTNY